LIITRWKCISVKGVEKKKREKKRQEGYGRGMWDKEGCKEFRETLGRIGENVEIIRERMEGKVRKVLREIEEGREKERRKGRMVEQGM